MYVIPLKSPFFQYSDLEEKNYTLSELKVEGNKLIIPKNIIEDVYELDDEKEYTVEDFEEVQKLRIKACSDCNLMVVNLKCIPFIISKEIKNWKEVKNFISQHFEKYGFVKNCMYSPKDLGLYPKDEKEALYNMKNSQRTKDTTIGNHIVMKELRHSFNYWRCFWINDKLRVIINQNETDHKTILEYFEENKYDIPYHTCCIELCETKEHGIEVMEFNALGPDLICDPSPFEWSQDWEKIYFTEEVIVKYI